MPLYEYEDRVTGERVELFKPLHARYDVPANLLPVISLPAPARMGDGLPDPSNAHQAVPRALREEEQRIGTAELARQSGFTAKEMKRIWNIK